MRNAALRTFHDRMPVIIARATTRSWLDPKQAFDDLLVPYPDEFVALHDGRNCLGQRARVYTGDLAGLRDASRKPRFEHAGRCGVTYPCALRFARHRTRQ